MRMSEPRRQPDGSWIVDIELAAGESLVIEDFPVELLDLDYFKVADLARYVRKEKS